jgi:hypothetical protein
MLTKKMLGSSPSSIMYFSLYAELKKTSNYTGLFLLDF